MNILITGGAGFIGAHLTSKLVHMGHTVTVVDNLYTSRLSNLTSVSSQITFIEADVTTWIPNQLFDQIYNLACPASPVHYQHQPISTLKTSVIGTLNLLEHAAATGARLFQASTSEVYGDPTIHPQPENYWGNVNPIGIRSCYDEGKRAAETLCGDFARTRHVEVRIARIFNTYGPMMRADDGRVVSNFIVQALQNNPITLYGDGRQTRSFCYVSDLVDGCIRLMNSDLQATPINLGNPGEFTVTDLAHKIIALTQSTSPLTYLPLPQDDPKVRRPDITAASTLIGWTPSISLDSGLIPTIEYFRSIIS
ncbi:SDR family oxidoreductase [bacterium]|nr:SDR family oxidoreductase [bacterium]